MIAFEAEVQSLTQDVEVGISSTLIYAFSPTAIIQQQPNGYYLITITDKNGTTTAEIPVISEQNIEKIISDYIASHPISDEVIEQHNTSTEAHEDIRKLIQDAINAIPSKTSDLENDSDFATQSDVKSSAEEALKEAKNYVDKSAFINNFKDLLVYYDSAYEFPNIPSDEQKDMIFVDSSTGDIFVFGLNDTLVYTPIGLANNDTIYGGGSKDFD